MIGTLEKNRESPARRRFLTGAVKDDCSPNLMPRAENRQGLRCEINSDPHRTIRNPRIIPHERAMAHRASNVKDTSYFALLSIF